jgi:hypothetical protein
MVIIPVFVVVLCVLIIWFTAEYLVGFYLYPASLDVYGLLSFEFQTIDTVKKKIKQSDSHYMTRLLRSIPLRITKFKKGWNDDECFDAMVYSIILFLSQTKKAEVMEFSFADDEEALRHPLMRELSEDDLRKYREEEKKLQELANRFGSIAQNVSPENQELQELRKDLDGIQRLAKETLHATILCVKKLPFTGRPKRQKARVVASPSEVMTKLQEN